MIDAVNGAAVTVNVVLMSVAAVKAEFPAKA